MRISVFLLQAALANPAPKSLDTLRLVTTEIAPLRMRIGSDSMGGSMIEIVEELSKRTGIPVRIRFLPWKRAISEVEDGRSDGIFDIGKTQERLQWAVFTRQPLFLVSYLMFHRKDDRLKMDSEFRAATSLRIGIQTGFAYGGAFQNAIDSHRFENIQVAPDLSTNVKKLANDRIDIFVGERISTLHYLKVANLHEQIAPIKDSTTGKPIVASIWPTYLAFSKKTVSPKIIAKFDRSLTEMVRDGTWDRILRAYEN